MRKLGIDIGSRKVKICLKDGLKFKFKSLSTIKFFKDTGDCTDGRFFINKGSLLKLLNEPLRDIQIIATGYGKGNLNISGVKIVSEIEAHKNGIIYQTDLKDFTLIDIGGQDIKVVLVKNDKIVDFEMNDKCAAGTGRYLENIANILKVSVSKLGKFIDNPVELSHTCAIFAETEIVTKIAEGYEIDSLCAGANLSVARRIVPLIRAFNSKKLVLSGGVSKNTAIRFFLEEETGKEIVVPKKPQYNGAIGCLV